MEQDFIPYQANQHRPDARVLVLAPHPDDEVLGCGGAVIAHVKQKNFIQVVIVTDGRMAEPQHPDPAAYVRLRQQESQQVADLIGYPSPIFWDYIDRQLDQADDLCAKIMQQIVDKNIEMVYTPSLHEVHPDHFALAQASVEAVTRLAEKNINIQLVMYDVGIPLAANIMLDITPVWDLKYQAMQYFQTQLKIQDYTRHMQALDEYRSYTLGSQVMAAEAYYVIDGQDLLAEPQLCFGHSQQGLYYQALIEK